jgi:SH3 domain-containing YSC84-like protein 1
MFALEAWSAGFQIGGQATGFVLLVMNDSGARSVMSSKVKLGGDASVAAGPVGCDAAAATPNAAWVILDPVFKNVKT